MYLSVRDDSLTTLGKSVFFFFVFFFFFFFFCLFFSGIFFLIVPFPDHCLLSYLEIHHEDRIIH